MLDQDFKFKPSKQYILLLTITFVASMGIIACLTVANAIKLAAMGFDLVYGAHTIWRYGLLKSPFSIMGIKKIMDEKWELQLPGKTLEATLCKDSTVTGIVTILRFKVSTERFTQSCIIFRDAMLPDEYRQLLVILKNT